MGTMTQELSKRAFNKKSTFELKMEKPTPQTIAGCKGLMINEHGHIVKDNVNHPSHYTDGSIEVIDYIEDKGFNYHLGQAIKYISRAGKKDPAKYVEDLEKARWYISREIARMSK